VLRNIITVNLTNAAPVVAHVFTASGSDITGPPLYSPISDSGATVSTDVSSQGINVPATACSWRGFRNQNGVSGVTALSGFTLDAQSTGYLWAESQSVLNAGTYSSHFLLSSANQLAKRGGRIKSCPLIPVAQNQSLTTRQALNITIAATSPGGLPLTYAVVTMPTHAH